MISQISSNTKTKQIKSEFQYEQSVIGMSFTDWIKLINAVRKLNTWLFDAKQQFRSNYLFVQIFPNLKFSSLNPNIWLSGYIAAF